MLHSSPKLKPWLPWLLLLAVCLFFFFYKLGSYPLFDADEPRYAEAGREMLALGNWITPYFNFEVRFDKPVFFYWLIAIAYQWFGITEFAARFFSAFSASAMVLMLYGFGRYCHSERLGLFSALILASSLEFIGLSRMSITDMTLSVLMGITMLCLFLAVQRSPKWWLAAGLFSAMALLTKGPVGLVLPGLVITVYALLTRQLRVCFLNRYFPLGLALSLLLALPWYVLAYLQNGPAFLDALFFHNITRFSTVVTGHYQPWYFFILVIVAGFLPWSLFLPASAVFWLKYIPLKQGNIKDFPLLRYSGVWITVVFLFFTVAHTKLLTYILPIFPGLALWMGLAWTKLSESSFQKRAFLISAICLLGIATIISGIVIIQPGILFPHGIKGLIPDIWTQLPVLMLWFAIAVSTGLLYCNKYTGTLLSLVAGMLCLTLAAVNGFIPKANALAQGPLLAFLKEAGHEPLWTFEISKPSLTYYARKKIPHIAKKDKRFLQKLFSQNGKRGYIITKPEFLGALIKIKPIGTTLQKVDQSGRFILVHLEPSSEASRPVVPLSSKLTKK